MSERAIRQALEPLGLEIVPFDEEQAYTAGLLRVATKGTGLSLGDRGCLSLAQRLNCPALTADRSWLDLSIGANINVIR